VSTSQLTDAWAADRTLAGVTERSRFLFNITPTNSEEAWRSFETSGYSEAPVFDYRPLGFDVDAAKRELYDLELGGIGDDVVTHLLESKRAELDASLTLLSQRDTPAFLHGSVALHGEVDDDLLAVATRILGHGRPPTPAERFVDAEEFAQRARAEIELYRSQDPELDAVVQVRDDVTSLMVVFGDLIVGAASRFRPQRVEALIHHEVGVHIVTHHNGSKQPMTLLSVGLAGYEETQEAIAVIAEYLAGGFDPGRLRVLAARVVAARRVVDGSDFPSVFHELLKDGAGHRPAWDTTMRAFRCGGTTKDAIYLRGLLRLVEYLRQGHKLKPLLVGKLPLEDVLMVEELLSRGVLRAPALRPRWLDLDGASERLEVLKRGATVDDLVTEAQGRQT
jgi:uncharacterized protein (TIGR02421 family)